MKMLKQWLRRTAALLLSAVTLITVAAAAEQNGASDSSAAKWLLQWALGDWLPSDGPSLPVWLALYQSPALLTARPQVLSYLTEQQAETQEAKATPEIP